MKPHIVYLVISLTALVFLTTCSKEEICDTCLFTYADSGFYGLNILNLHDTVYVADRGPDIGDGKYCSMKASLPDPTSKLMVTIEDKRVAVYNNQGWLTNWDPWTYDNYVFQAEGQTTADLKIHFNDPGQVIIKIYENNFDSYSRMKVIRLK